MLESRVKRSIAHRVPEKKHAVRAAAVKRDPVNHVGLSRLDRLQQAWIILRIVFQVGILNDHDITGDMAKRSVERSSLTLVVRLKKNFDLIQRILGASVLFL